HGTFGMLLLNEQEHLGLHWCKHVVRAANRQNERKHENVSGDDKNQNGRPKRRRSRPCHAVLSGPDGFPTAHTSNWFRAPFPRPRRRKASRRPSHYGASWSAQELKTLKALAKAGTPT